MCLSVEGGLHEALHSPRPLAVCRLARLWACPDRDKGLRGWGVDSVSAMREREPMILALLRLLVQSDYDVGSVSLTPKQLREAEAWTLAQADPRQAVITRHAERDHRAFWAQVDRRFTLIHGKRA
jgi:hypothetical protein